MQTPEAWLQPKFYTFSPVPGLLKYLTSLSLALPRRVVHGSEKGV